MDRHAARLCETIDVKCATSASDALLYGYYGYIDIVDGVLCAVLCACNLQTDIGVQFNVSIYKYKKE